MANKRIQDLPAKGATIAANDILEVSEYQSPGVYISKKILGSELGGVTTFTALTDTPASYTGQTLKFVRVNAGETALEFATVSVSDTNIANTQLTLPTGTRKLIFGGANSTDVLAFRNSTDTASIAEFRGNGDILLGESATGVVTAGSPIISIGKTAKASQYGISIGNNAGKNQDNNDRRNIYIGYGVAENGTNATASGNIGIGLFTFRGVTSGSSNVAIGTDPTGVNTALNALTTGNLNISIGLASCGALTTGANNVATGAFAGAFNVSGSTNSNYGYGSLHLNGANPSYTSTYGSMLMSGHSGVIMLGSSGDLGNYAQSITSDVAQFHFRSTAQSFFVNKNTNLVLNSQVNLVAGTHFEAAATNTQTVHNGTAPITNIANAYQQYSADVVAGNAAPHFRTEAGDVIKLYKQASAGITTVGDLVTVLTNLGLLG